MIVETESVIKESVLMRMAAKKARKKEKKKKFVGGRKSMEKGGWLEEDGWRRTERMIAAGLCVVCILAGGLRDSRQQQHREVVKTVLEPY